MTQTTGFKTIDFDVKQTAAAMRKELRAQFPGTKFSVTMDRGSAYGWLIVRWEAGPVEWEVRDITDMFQSSYFSGSDDSYHSIEPTLYLVDGELVIRRYSCRGVELVHSVGE